MIIRLGLILCFLLIASPGLAQQVEVKVTVTPREVPANEQVLVVISVSGPNSDKATLEPPTQGTNMLRSGTVSTTSSIQIINGRMRAQKSFTLTYAPSGSAQGEVPSFIVNVAGNKYQTTPVPVTITGASANQRTIQRRPTPTQSDVPVMVLSEISHRRLYVGESLTLKYRLLFRHRVTGLIGPQVVDAPPSFVAEDLEVDRDVQRTEHEGNSWNEVILFHQRLSPTKSGKLTIDPIQFEFQVDDPRRSFFSLSNSITIQRTAPGLTVNVLPLPAAGRPPDFSGAVGRFELKAELDRTELSAGDAAALTVILEGTGSLDATTPPDVPEVADIRYFDPDVSNGRRNRRSWTYPIVPQSAGEFTLPSISWSYFDPEAESYRTLRTQPLSMLVTPGEGTALSQRIPSGRRIQTLATDLHFIKPAPAVLADRRDDLYRQTWYWMLVGLPWVAIPSVMLAGWQRQRFTRSTFARERRAARDARKRLKQAGTYLEQGESTEALRSASDAMANYVADRTQRAAQGLTYETLAGLATQGGASPEVSQELRDVVEQFDELRYTPGGSPNKEIQGLIEQASRVVSRLEKEWR